MVIIDKFFARLMCTFPLTAVIMCLFLSELSLAAWSPHCLGNRKRVEFHSYVN